MEVDREESLKCKSCGSDLAEDSKFCFNCGNSVIEVSDAKKEIENRKSTFRKLNPKKKQES